MNWAQFSETLNITFSTSPAFLRTPTSLGDAVAEFQGPLNSRTTPPVQVVFAQLLA
jgi:hypothetical protein